MHHPASPSTDPAPGCASGCQGGEAPAGGPSRRTVLRGAAATCVAGAGAVGLAACGPGSGSGSGDSARSAPSGPVDLGPASEVPVGGGVVHREDRIVVTQPAKGEYKAFSAVCTHAGCVVDAVADGLIQCPCHGSRFRVADGSVADGPAPTGLPAVALKVQDGKLIAGA